MERLLTAMIEYDRGDAPRIQHFIKVYEFARIIGKLEKLDEHTQLILESAAIVHDIGIHMAERKYGRGTCGGGKAAQGSGMAFGRDREGFLLGGASSYLQEYGRAGLSDSCGSRFPGKSIRGRYFSCRAEARIRENF